MAHTTIEDRVAAHLERRIALLESQIADLDQFGDAPEGEAASALLERQRRRAAETQTLLHEYEVLLREWRAEQQSPDAHARITALGGHAEALAGTVRARLDAAAINARTRGGEYKKMLDDMRRGHGLLRKLRTESGADNAGFLDSKA